MAREILINVDLQEKRVAITQDKVLEEFYIERPQDKTIVGNIYKGIIEAAIPSINGAFVDIGLQKKGFLYLSEIESAYDPLDTAEAGHTPTKNTPREVKKGQEVLVQVVKESFGTKGPRLSCHIGIAGRYMVLMPLDNQRGISRKIEDDQERKRIKQILHEIKLPTDVGFIVRTAASGKSKNDLLRDANYLIKVWKGLEKTIARQKAPSLVYEEYDLVLRTIRDSFTEDVSKLAVDSKPEFYRIQRFMNTFMRHLRRKVEFYRGHDLFLDREVERQINRIFETRVYLKNKGYIIIEPTEGLVVIDVNSGGFKEKISQEEAAFKINCEAANEAAHQLKLRDLGGIIVIDFIDMERESHRRQVLHVLKQALHADKAKYDILGISKFGLVEMTRERVHNTVQTMAFQNCPYCGGKGRVKSPTTMAIFALKELKKYLKDKRLREVSLSLHPDVVTELQRNKETIKQFEHTSRTRVKLNAAPALKIEDIAIS